MALQKCREKIAIARLKIKSIIFAGSSPRQGFVRSAATNKTCSLLSALVAMVLGLGKFMLSK
jgi:hypothetical protein